MRERVGTSRSTPVEMRRATLIFLKHPHPGRVKTRLGRSIGHEAASALYRGFVEALVGEARRGGLDPILCCDPAEPQAAYRAWLGEATYRPQQGDDLGERMEAALRQALAEGAETAVLVGSDSPQLDAAWLGRAHDALSRASVVLGPSRDGGYYLVGVRGGVPDLFRDVPWSTAAVLDVTLRRAERLGVAVQVLEGSFDVDDLDDLRLLLERLDRHPHLEPLRPALIAALQGPAGAAG